jgi:hypothetical protein
MPAPFSLTADGHELQWQSNYLSHVLLTDLLLPLLERSAKGTRARTHARVHPRAELCGTRACCAVQLPAKAASSWCPAWCITSATRAASAGIS